MFYSPTTGGFYVKPIHANIPADAVEITEADHTALLAGQSEGQRIVADENGRPVLVDPPAPTDDVLAQSARAKRDRLLSASDWVVTRSIETGDAVPLSWLTYRQGLRAVPDQPGFPRIIEWPDMPLSEG